MRDRKGDGAFSAHTDIKSPVPFPVADGLDAKGIDPVMLGTLDAIMTGQEYNPSFMSDSLCDGGKMGPWVFEVPADLVRRLADLTQLQLAEVGDK